MKLITIIRLLLMTGMACASLTAKAALQGDFDPKHLYPSRELVTPHVKWLTPSAEGPLKVLFIVSMEQMREIVELAQRMDLDYQVAVIGDFKHCETGASTLPPLQPADFRRDLQEKIESGVDLIVVSGPQWKDFSYMQRYQLLKKVKDGTSLLTFAAEADEYLTRAAKNKVKENFPWLVPWKGLPAFSTNYAGTAEFQAGTLEKAVFGKGSIYLLKGYKTVPLQMLTPGMKELKRPPRADPCRYAEDATFELNPAEYDYYLGMIIHIMRASARKTSPVEVQGDDYLKVDRDNPIPVSFTIKSADDRQVVLRFAVRTRQGNVLVERQQTMQLKSGENKAAFETGKIPSGDYFADLWVQDNEKILEFGSIYIEANGTNTLAGVEINSSIRTGQGVLQLDGKPIQHAGAAIHPNEGASGKILLNLNPQAEGLTLKIRQRDNFGRITANVSLPITREMADKKEIAFALPATTPLTIIQYLDVELCRGEDILDKKSKWFSICDFSPTDDVSFLIWAESGRRLSYLSYYGFKNFYDSGFDTHAVYFSEPALLANMRYMPIATRLVDKPVDRKKEPRKVPHVREPCLTDPDYRKTEREKLARTAARLRPFSVNVFSLGDENRFLYLYQILKEELCFSPTCSAAFHDLLKKEYNTIENLNKEYGTIFKSFDDIKPLTLDEVRKDPKLIPLWVDFRRHMESTWAEMLAFCRDAVQKEIPGARVGYEAADYDYINSLQGFDWQKIMNALQWNYTYDGVFAPYAVVDLSRPGAMLGTGPYGGYEQYKKYNDWDSRAYHQYISWRHLFRGANMFIVFAPYLNYWFGYGHGSITAPDFSFLECFTPNIPEMKEIKSGAGKLLMNAKRENDRTAILYSASSVHAATLSDSADIIEGVLRSLVPLMEDTHRQFKIISYQQLADGVLEKDGYAFLILPYAQALSQKEVENIRSFAKNGGTVIADVRPGICNEHGKAYAKGALDDIFGVLHNPCVTQKLANATLAFNDPALPTNIITLADATLKIQSGQAQAKAGEAPALIVNGYGKGKAILMNFTLHQYQKNEDVLAIEIERLSWQVPEIRAIFERILDLAGIKQKIKFAPEISGLRAYRYQAGNLHYVGFLQHPCRARAAQFGEIKTYKLTFNRTQIPVPVKTTATLDGKYHVYDIRRGKYLGYTDTIPMEVGPGRAEFYSLLPYEVQGLEIRAPGRVRQGEVLDWSAQLKIKGDKAGLHIFRITLKSPSGKEIGYYADNVKAEQGRASGKIPLALNDEPGLWTLRIKDTASGQTVDAEFKIDQY